MNSHGVKIVDCCWNCKNSDVYVDNNTLCCECSFGVFNETKGRRSVMVSCDKYEFDEWLCDA